MHRCRKICNFEVPKKQSVTYVLMCKGTTNNRNEQVQTDFFDLFDVKKKVEVSFTAPDMTNLGGLPVLRRIILFLRKYWKHTVIVVRGDSMFCSHEFMEWAETVKRDRMERDSERYGDYICKFCRQNKQRLWNSDGL